MRTPSFRKPADVPLERPDLAGAYGRETLVQLRSRLWPTAGLFVALVGAADVVESLQKPSFAATLWATWAVQLTLAAVVLVWAAVEDPPRWTRRLGTLLFAADGLMLAFYNAYSHGTAERLAMAQTCLLAGLSVMLPLGGAGQLVVAVVASGATLAALPWLTKADGVAFVMIGMLTAAVTSTIGAVLLDRYRRASFVQAAVAEEEARIAATLAQIGEALTVHAHQPDLLERLGALGTEALGCDWINIYLATPDEGALRLAASHGLPPEREAQLLQRELLDLDLPHLKSLVREDLLEIPDMAVAPFRPNALVGELGVRSALWAPITSSGVCIGAIAYDWQRRSGAFAPRHRRLAVGIAHAAAVALQNSRLIADLKVANRLKSDFVATMSHELRTPLNVIIGYAELLSEEELGPLTGGQRDAIVRLQRSALELLDLVTATLDVSRLDAGREPVDQAPLVVDDLFALLAQEVADLVPAGVQVRFENDAGTAVRRSDPPKVKTILKNLIGNALKFTEAGSVTVRAHDADDGLVFDVRDTGIGIPEASLPIVFDMFRQVDGSSTRRHGGVGLGLHIVQRLTALLGGRVSVESTVGEGSTFRVWLPVAAGDQSARLSA